MNAMTMCTPEKTDLEIPPPPNSPQAKRPYATPRLTRHGDVRAMTMAGSPGNGDTNDTGSQEA